MAILRVTGHYGYYDGRIQSGNTWRWGPASTSTISLSARSPRDQAPLCVDERIQVVRQRCYHDCRNRAGTPDSQAPVLVRTRPPASQLVVEATMAEGTRIGWLSPSGGIRSLRASAVAPEPP